jgi:hypothetical protein
MLQVYGGKGEQKHRQIQFGGSAQQVILLSLHFTLLMFLRKVRRFSVQIKC